MVFKMKKAKILVVEDDARVVIFVVDQLESLGHQVSVARNGIDAIKKVAKDKPDLIVLDVMMPEMDGYEVCNNLKAAPETRDIPILMLTAKGQSRDIITGLEKGADDYLPKPYEEDIFKARVTALLRRSLFTPFKTDSNCASLLISCRPQQSLNVHIRGTLSNNLISKKPLDIDPFVYARRADNTPIHDWRFNSKELGESLYIKLFNEHPKIYGIYNQALGILDSESRLHICLESDRDFLRVPIEFLFGNGDYLVLKHPLIRSIRDVSVKKKSLSPSFFNDLIVSEENLKILLIASDTGGIPGVDHEIDFLTKLIKQLFQNQGLKVDIESIPTKEATYETIKEILRDCRSHIIHYAGHGSYDVESPEKSSIFFYEMQNYQGRVKKMPLTELQMLLQDSEVRFVYLSCCLGTATSENRKLLDDDFLGIADGLVHAKIPSVLGFRWAVSDSGAVKISQAFYKSLAKHGEIDVALLEARRDIAGKDRDDITWLSPILIVQ